MRAAPSPRRVDVVVHTHWDREWYFDHETFAARLARVMRHVLPLLESGELPTFLLDGQTAAYRDLLLRCEPAMADRLRVQAARGSLILGPWHVMADEFLVSGESLLRNLEAGIFDARAAGNCQWVGYLPDTFGHVGQMPQILRQFGIATAVLWRGVRPEQSEFDWEAPDGTTVATLHLGEGYYQHPFNLPGWEAALTSYLAKVAPLSQAPELLLTQGGDHLLPAAGLAGRITEFNARQQDYQLRFATLEAHVAAAMSATAGSRPKVQGELRDNQGAFVLPDVLSTRRHLKRLHQQAEDRLLHEIEPLAAMLRLPDDLPQAALDQCWRILLGQQAHDSLCGCSIDAVHREMETRFAQLESRLDALRAGLLAEAGFTSEFAHGPAPSAFADDTRFTLFNPLPKVWSGGVEVTLFVETPPALPQVVTTDGVALPTTVVARRRTARFTSPLDDFPDLRHGEALTLRIEAALPGLGRLACRLTGADSQAASQSAGVHVEQNAASRILQQGCSLGNEFIRITWGPAGTLLFAAPATGIEIPGALSLLFELDAGDTYNFSPPANPCRERISRFGFISLTEQAGMQALELSLQVERPAGLAEDRRGPDAQRVRCEGRLVLRLFAGDPVVQVELRWRNAARDQRVRLCLALPKPITHTTADSAFDWVKRPVALADRAPLAPGRESRISVLPSLSALAAGPWRIAHRALQEFEVVEEDGKLLLGLTLLRCVGWLSRRDLVTRTAGAGPDLATPEAQCLGGETYTLRLSLEGDEISALRMAEDLRRGPVFLPGHSDAWIAPAELAADPVQVSAVRRVGGHLEVRLWNPSDDSQPVRSEGWTTVRADGDPLPDCGGRLPARSLLTLRRSL